MQIRKVEGLESLLQSLSLDEEPGKIHHVVYPWNEYSRIPGRDIGFWYSAERCQYSTLRRLILESFNRIGHPSSDRLADGLVLAFILMPKAGDVLTEFERVLNSFVAADVSQFLFIPASALIRYVTVGQSPKHGIIGLFGHGPFRYAPLAGDLMERIKYRFERIGLGGLLPELAKFFGCIAVYREPQSTKVIDFTGLGFKGHQPPTVANLMQYYFDNLSETLFEDFWQKHLESQYLGVAAGANLLDRVSLEALPGTGWLSIFWGFDLLTGKGTISLIADQSYRRDTLAMQVHSLGTELAEAKRRMEIEITEHLGPGPHAVYPSLLNFARLVALSRELQNRHYVAESFTLLMVALESLLAERESISTTLSRRAGALLAVSGDKPFEDSVKSIRKLYDTRSDFVHQGEVIELDSLRALQEVCRTVFFSAYRSQARFAQAGAGENDWKRKWTATLDYVSACFEAGVPVDSEAVSNSGALRDQPGRASG
jgi:hypothetical protein